jgi:predicted N-acetyltransferase YhbS
MVQEEKAKEEEKRKEKRLEAPSALKRKELLEDLSIASNESAQIKKLTEEDIDEVVKLMRSALFEIGTREIKQIKEIISEGNSYGACVERFIVGVGLAWPVHFERAEKTFDTGQEANAIYMEEVAVLNEYQGKGIIEMLIEEREMEAKRNGLEYAVGLCGELPEGDIRENIEKGGSLMQKKYLLLNYRFAKTQGGLIAFKRV